MICIKQHIRNIWSSIDENVKQQWGWLEKSVAYKKKQACTATTTSKIFNCASLIKASEAYLEPCQKYEMERFAEIEAIS